MLDLSNNNATGHNFKTAFVKGGQRRLYLKLVEGTHFVDGTYADLRKRALAAGFHVGAYDFLHPLEASAAVAAKYMLDRLPKKLAAHDLRPALDVEFGTPSAEVGAWVSDVAKIVAKKIGTKPVIYGSGYYLQDCQFKAAPGPLWLAAYGRNDGKEYPIGMIPKPWTSVAAHQYTSEATVVGIKGHVDLSFVFVPKSIDLPPTLV